jgi:hypothetical protein
MRLVIQLQYEKRFHSAVTDDDKVHRLHSNGIETPPERRCACFYSDKIGKAHLCQNIATARDTPLKNCKETTFRISKDRDSYIWQAGCRFGSTVVREHEEKEATTSKEEKEGQPQVRVELFHLPIVSGSNRSY